MPPHQQRGQRRRPVRQIRPSDAPSAQTGTVATQPASAGGSGRRGMAINTAPPDYALEYRHIGHDLGRIATWSIILFIGMMVFWVLVHNNLIHLG